MDRQGAATSAIALAKGQVVAAAVASLMAKGMAAAAVAGGKFCQTSEIDHGRSDKDVDMKDHKKCGHLHKGNIFCPQLHHQILCSSPLHVCLTFQSLLGMFLDSLFHRF